MLHPAYQGQQNPLLVELDELSGLLTNKLRIMERAAKADRPKYRAEVRAMLVSYAAKAMHAADTFS